MSLYYEAATLEIVRDAFDTLQGYSEIDSRDRAWGGPSNHYTSTETRLSDVRAAYRGGAASALRFLRPKPGESPDQLNARRQLIQNVPLVRSYVSGRAGMLYAEPPEREIKLKDAKRDDPDSVDLDKGVNRVYEKSCHKTLFRKSVIESAIRDDYAVIKIRSEGDSDIRLSYLPAHNVMFVVSPDDLNTCLGVVEIRKVKQSYESYLWTLTDHGPISDKWKWIGAPQVNDLGLIPFVCFGTLPISPDRARTTEDITMDQRNLINVRSANALGMRSQVFPTAVTTGVVTGPFFTGADGQERLYISPESAVELSEGGSFDYKNPGLDLTALMDAELRMVKQSLEMYGVSGFSIDPSGAPDQPMALLIKMFKPLLLRREDAAMFESAERQLVESVAAMGADMGLWSALAADPDNLDIAINYSETILPMDQAAEKQGDLASVSAGLMLREDYVKRWVMDEGATQDDVGEYLIKLDAEKAAAQSQIPPRGNGSNVATALMARLGGTPGAPTPKDEAAAPQAAVA